MCLSKVILLKSTGTLFFILLLILVYGRASAQISPGELTQAHSHLEGMSHCTDCHTLGARVSNDKCLDCHLDLRNRIESRRGYHSSSKLKGKECSSCHSEHHGRSFRIINFDTENFNHQLTGFELLGAHAKEECKNCHKPEFIPDPKIRSKDFTFLGLNTECLSCHADYHQNTLSANCTDCHGMNKFKPAEKFSHENTKYPLAGKHKEVTCEKCHKIETVNGAKFQEFAGVPFGNCTSCHQDPHHDKFGQNCKQCHTEESFYTISSLNNFNHDRTDYPLRDKHLSVSCSQCHKTRYTDPVKHDRCSDCHTDYHQGQFVRDGKNPDCSACHSTRGFKESSYTLEQHNNSDFPLMGAHLATPCFVCHKKQERWNFRDIGMKCVDCHEDIHKSFIDEKYYPGEDCRKCHTSNRWNEVNFNHSSTNFNLTGAHNNVSCRKCHFKEADQGNSRQIFKGLSSSCSDCHQDVHAGQFETAGVTKCDRCHATDNWKASKFDHNQTRFVLDGKHKDLACNKCHKPVHSGELTYVKYKFDDIRCEACHH